MTNITQQLEFYKKEREQSVNKIKHLEQALSGERSRLDQLTGAVFALESALASLQSVSDKEKAAVAVESATESGVQNGPQA